jgi:glycosyltransferase involved in cell wall biosynthesis
MLKPKILIITSTFPTFTVGNTTPPFIYELTKGIAEISELELIVLTPYIKGGKLYEQVGDIKIYRFKYGFTALCDGAIWPNLKKNKFLWLQVPLFLFFYLINLAKIITKEKIKLIHAHWVLPQGLIAIIYKKFFDNKIKIICTAHGTDLHKMQNKIFRYLKKIVLHNIEMLTIVSSNLIKEIDKLSLKTKPPIKVLPMGVDDKKFSPNNYQEQIRKKYQINNLFLLFVGRLSEEKGVKYLISAMPTIVNKYKDIKLLIVGNGPLKNILNEQVDNLKLSNNILFLDSVPHDKLPPYFATADIFIGPSIREGFGLVFVEALMSKTCVLASNLSTISDIIIHNQTGLQVDVKDKEVFSGAIMRLIEEEKLRNYLAENGYKYVKNKFSLKKIADQYNQSIKKVYGHS